MVKTHFISAVRALLKNKSVNIINICGLTIGLTSFLLIIHYLVYEVSFDTFFPESADIYRVNMDIKKGSDVFYHGAKTSRGVYFSCREGVPGVKEAGDAYFESCLMRYEDIKLAEQRVLWVDKGFEKVFPFRMVRGTVDFENPLKGIIAKSKVQALFRNEDPIGKVIGVNEGMTVEITGIYEDLPANTHLTADYFVSIPTWEYYGYLSRGPSWNYNGYWNYIKIEPRTDIHDLERTLTDIVNKNSYRGNDIRKATIFLQPVKDLHYINGLEGELGAQTALKSLYFLLVIAILTIVVAWINYIDLSTALAVKRADEIGMRKLIGATGFHLWVQALIETVILNLISIIISYLLYRLLINLFAGIFDIPLDQAYIPGKYISLALIAITIAGIFFSSIYNTVTLARLNPFSGKRMSYRKHRFQKGMVIFQMTLSIIFISITLVVYKQINYMKNADIGMDLHNVITINAPASLNSDTTKFTRYLAFREETLGYPEFSYVTADFFTSGQAPMYGAVEFFRRDAGIMANSTVFQNSVDDGFIGTFRLKLLAGENFLPRASQNRRKLLINEKGIKELGFRTPEEAVGHFIQRTGRRDTMSFELIGVLGDFNNESLHKPVYPMVFNNIHPSSFGYYSVRINSPHLAQSIRILESIWNKHYPTDPMSFVFADEFYLLQYKSETRFGKFYSMLGLLSLLITCLGLYGLFVFYLNQKRNEISIRKINGAEITDVTKMLFKDFLRWLVVALVIAIPVSWLVMQKWLENFAYKTHLSWLIFLEAGLCVLVTTVLTVTWQSFIAATRNPVEALRYE